MKRICATVLLGACLLMMPGVVFASAEHQQAVREDTGGAVLHLLTSINWEPDEKQWRQAGGSGIRNILEQYLNDENRPETTRMRALHALRYFTPKAFILQFSRDRYPVALRRIAVRSLGEQWGVEALGDLGTLSTDKEPLVRDAVAATLTFVDAPQAVTLLETMAAAESHPVVADTIRQALAYRRRH